VAAAELGLRVDDPARPLTVTGGLTFAGGPWSNYVMHSIATMAELLAANPGRYGLVTANGGYLTKHSFGVYSTEPPAEFRWEDTQPAVDREPTTEAVVGWEGVGTVEAWTTPYDREGQPEKAFLAVRTPDGSRALAVVTDAAAARESVREDIGGAKVAVAADGRAPLQ
jgi:acetyl-CoA C-acetyltransferase